MTGDRAGTYRAARRFINRIYPGRGRLLEVGSGQGGLLAAFKEDGWRVHGIDPDETCCHEATARHHVATHCVTLRDAEIPEGAFDVVVLARAAACLDDPLAGLTQINRILRPGGHCLIDIPHLRRAGAVWAPQIITDTGFLVVCHPAIGSGWRAVLRALARRLGLHRLRPAGLWRRVWLQKIAPAAAGMPSHGATRDPTTGRPAWLSREVAGAVTAHAGRSVQQANIRRGYPWRRPDRRVAVRGSVLLSR